jgi:hypothetical protein
LADTAKNLHLWDRHHPNEASSCGAAARHVIAAPQQFAQTLPPGRSLPSGDKAPCIDGPLRGQEARAGWQEMRVDGRAAVAASRGAARATGATP